jgi:beta-mannosidase
MNRFQPMHDGWTVSAVTGNPAYTGVAATVPGCVHTDLLAAGLIDDPYLDDNETRLGWIGRTGWCYRTAFRWAPDSQCRTDLVFDGLDTVAAISLNGEDLGRTANMHRRYRFDVTGLLAPGRNILQVLFTAPYEYAEALRAQLGPRPSPYGEPYPFIRKMACNFGWDWGPALVTSGIWRPAGLHTWTGASIAQVRPVITVEGSTGLVHAGVRIERHDSDGPVPVVAEVAGRLAEAVIEAGQDETVLSVEVPGAALWWPRGYGAQPLYDLTIRVEGDAWTRRIGFRTAELEPDAFRLVINGRPVFVKGFNWIPDDCFPARITTQRLSQRLGQAIEAGANLLRVWGGGVYESDDFYRLADELGILVWQDFPFACAAYPEEEPLRSEVEAEARDNIVRLSPHPSLVLWCGNNENIEGYQHWGWPEPLAGRSWGAAYYFDLLPRLVSELDPARPYWPGSPYSGTPDRDARDPSSGTVHLWTVWNHRDYTHYADYTPRFVAEFGFQGPPAWATLREAVSDDPLTPDSPGVIHHQKALEGSAKLLRGLGDHLPPPSTFDDWHYYTQLNQARAVSFGVQRFRALMPYCMGTVVWQLNDCWPVTSWSAVDGAGRRKPLWYALRDAYAPRLLAFIDGDVAAVNDTDEPWTGRLELGRSTLASETLARQAVDLNVAPRAVARVPITGSLATPTDAASELLTAELGEVRALRMFAEDPVMAYPPAEFDATTAPAPDGMAVHITARTLLRELAIFPDRLDPAATIDGQLHTLLPGETIALRITTRRPLDVGRLLAYPVLRCVNEAPIRRA